ncbi:hypothetical protein [Haloferax sp. DFSO60]|uniref:hypothetical protein n=1 Tax=Haloferax sp. DFSO60 TaxID=3388652 RepID=UPI00397D7FBE
MTLGWLLSLFGAVGGVVTLPIAQFGLILYIIIYVFLPEEEFVGHATADAAIMYLVFFWGGLFFLLVFAWCLAYGIALLQRHSNQSYFDTDSLKGVLLDVGMGVLVLGPPVVGVGVVAMFGADETSASLALAFVAFCIGGILTCRAAWPAIR